MANYVIDENNNRIEAYSAQEIISILEQAIADGSLANVVAGVAVIDKIKCCVTGGTNNVAFVPSAKYNELEAAGTLKENTAYFITDDTSLDGLNEIIDGILSGEIEVQTAKTALSAEEINRTVVFDDLVRSGDTINCVIEKGYRYSVTIYESATQTTTYMGVAGYIDAAFSGDVEIVPAKARLNATSIYGYNTGMSCNSVTIETNKNANNSTISGVYNTSVNKDGAISYNTGLYIGSSAYRVKIVKLEKVF